MTATDKPGQPQPPVLVVGEQPPPGEQKDEQPHQRQVKDYEDEGFHLDFPARINPSARKEQALNFAADTAFPASEFTRLSQLNPLPQKAMSGAQIWQTLPTRSSPGFRVFLPGSQPAGVASSAFSRTYLQARI